MTCNPITKYSAVNLKLTNELITWECLSNEIIHECKLCTTSSSLPKILCEQLERLPLECRREIVKRKRDGCAPLFIACKRGNVVIAEYLITKCGADIEQRGLYEVPEDRSVHCVTPLWCAAVSGNLELVKCLIRLGSEINALSDTGSTPVRSACFMTHLIIVEYLVEHGADINKANYNGGTCLINSVQSVQLCMYLISKGADVNAKDIQDKTALHYAIQEHRFETTKLLLDYGADPFAKSRYGDDALQTACLKAAHSIFLYLKVRVSYTPERIIDAHELIGSTFLDEHNETRAAMLYWRLAHNLRIKGHTYIPKKPGVPARRAYGNNVEFSTWVELDNISLDVDAMRIQSLLICERVLGLHHKDTLFRLMYRGATYADSLRYQRCIDLWRLALQVRVERHSILYSDTCFTAQALIRLMLDLQDDVIDEEHIRYNEQSATQFEDVYAIFELLSNDLFESRKLLQIRPVHKKQQENFDRILKCITHLIYLLIVTSKTEDEKQKVHEVVQKVISGNFKSACTSDSLLHLCVSRLNMIKSGYFTEDHNVKLVFPNNDVVKLLVKCGADVNAKNESKSTPLHVAAIPYNYKFEIVKTLLDNGAHLDQPNRADEKPLFLLAINPMNMIPFMKYTSLKCLAATEIVKYKIPYKNQIPKTLEDYVRLHHP